MFVIRAIATIIWRDVRQSYASGGTWLPVIFYLSAATLFPFAVGPDRDLLLQTGGGRRCCRLTGWFSLIWRMAFMIS